MKTSLLILVVAAVATAWFRLAQRPQADSGASVSSQPSPAVITQEKAIEFARQACFGKIEIPQDAPIRVVNEPAGLTVYFIQQLPTGTLGGDCHAKVILDPDTGVVRQLLGSD